MGNEVKYQETMRDALALLVSRARELSGASTPFEQGLRMGYYEAVSALLGELETFGIDASEVGQSGFDPESLISPRRKAA